MISRNGSMARIAVTSGTAPDRPKVAHEAEEIHKGYPTYRPDIDGLRGIAVLAVVAFHAAPGRLPGGFIGVDIFFVISGFLISSILLGSLRNDAFSLTNFYARRIRRIFPALLVILAASLAVGWFVLLADEYKQLGKHVSAGAAFVSNFALWNESGYFDNAAQSKILLHLWSLGIEEQFYILWPVLLWLAWRRRISLPLMIAGLAASSFAANVALVAGAHSVAAFYSPFARAWELFAGALLACYRLGDIRLAAGFDRKASNDAFSIAGALLVIGGLLLIDKRSAFPGWWAGLPVVGTALLISAGPGAWLNRTVLARRALVWIGLISYPLYLWHWPILSFLRVFEGTEIAQWKRFLAVIAAFVLAWGTYRFIEMPVRHSARKKTVPLALFGLMAGMGLFGYWGYASNGFADRTNMPKVVNEGDIGHYTFFKYMFSHFFPCTPADINKATGDWNGFVRCFQSKQSGPLDMAILGDSHAEHLFLGLAEKLPNENIVYYGREGLPFLDNENLRRAFEYVLSDHDIKAVVLSTNWVERLAGYTPERLTRELDATVKALTSAGKKVYLTDGVPNFTFDPSRCKYVGRMGMENKCSEPDSRADSVYSPVFDSVRKENPEVKIIHTYDFFCREGTCAMARDGVLYFRDNNHLTVLGSQKIAQTIVDQMHGQ